MGSGNQFYFTSKKHVQYDLQINFMLHCNEMPSFHCMFIYFHFQISRQNSRPTLVWMCALNGCKHAHTNKHKLYAFKWVCSMPKWNVSHSFFAYNLQQAFIDKYTTHSHVEMMYHTHIDMNWHLQNEMEEEEKWSKTQKNCM